MNEQIHLSDLVGQKTRNVVLPSGLTVRMCPMEGFVSFQAMITVGIGSVDTGFIRDGKKNPLPAGIAHYLEHKMFDCSYGDAMERFFEFGADANAFTSYDKTAYYCSGTEYFDESLDTLMDFVSSPYFKEESVQREKGIIAEEIRMYLDNPDWRVMGNLLEVLYRNHPVRLDIAGTVESIQTVDAALLEECYYRFYRPDNMVLTVAGNFNPDKVLQIAGRYFNDHPYETVERLSEKEPDGIVSPYVEKKMLIANPIFEIGFKAPGNGGCSMERRIQDELVLDLICGETTDLYAQLYKEGLINTTFGSELMAGKDYICGLFDGESRNPRKVFDTLCGRVTELAENGIPKEDFKRCVKANYGRYISLYTRPSEVSGLMASAHFSDCKDIYYPLTLIKNTTLEQLQMRIKEDFNPDHAALSVILPVKD